MECNEIKQRKQDNRDTQLIFSFQNMGQLIHLIRGGNHVK